MTIGELIGRVQNLYNKGVKSDDSRLSNRLIFSKLLSVRAMLYKQNEQKKNSFGEEDYSLLECIRIIPVEPYSCPCLPSIGCKVYRTEHKLPKLFKGRNGVKIEYVSSLDRRRIFGITTTLKHKFSHSNRFSNTDEVIYEGGYLYVYGKNLPTYITVKAVLNNFLESFISTCEENCIDCEDCVSHLDMEFKIQDSLIEPILQITKQELVKEFSQMREDLTNDNKDSLIQQSK